MAEQCGTGPGVTHHAGCACHEQGWRNKWEVAVEMAAQAQVERDRLRAVIARLHRATLDDDRRTLNGYAMRHFVESQDYASADVCRMRIPSWTDDEFRVP